MAKSGWVLLGKVGVDSGQLLVCDPGYIDGEWSRKEVNFTNKLRVKKTGKIIPSPNALIKLGENVTWDNECPGLKMSYNNAMEKGLIEEIPNQPTSEFNYDGCCKATMTDTHQLNYKNGCPGAGVAFTSGLGDGYYEVWGKKKKLGNWGERIVEVKIILL